jgi:hypothetical protein
VNCLRKIWSHFRSFAANVRCRLRPDTSAAASPPSTPHPAVERRPCMRIIAQSPRHYLVRRAFNARADHPIFATTRQQWANSRTERLTHLPSGKVAGAVTICRSVWPKHVYPKQLGAVGGSIPAELAGLWSTCSCAETAANSCEARHSLSQALPS